MINKNDKLVIFLNGSVGSRNRCGFLTDLRVVWREKTTSIPPLSLTRDQKVNLSYIKRLECEFLYCCKLMLRLHRVVVCKVTIGFT